MVLRIFYFQYDPVDQQKLDFSQLSFPRFALQPVAVFSHSCSESEKTQKQMQILVLCLLYLAPKRRLSKHAADLRQVNQSLP